jgi:hypothetical protein
VCLSLSVGDDGLDALLLVIDLALHLGHHLVDAVDRVLERLVLRANAVTQRLLQLVQVVHDVVLHDRVRVRPPLLLRLQDVLYRLQLLSHTQQSRVLVRINRGIHFKYIYMS